MLKRLLRFLALSFLCTLLVYAPELYSPLADPYRPSPDKRTLLRIVLCTQDTADAKAFSSALSSYLSLHPALHIRLICADAEQLSSLSSPFPDLLIFPENLPFDPALFSVQQNAADAAFSFPVPSGDTLACRISADAQSPAQALDFLSYLSDYISQPRTSSL